MIEGNALVLIFSIPIILAVLYLLWVLIPAISGLPWIPTKPDRIRRGLALAQVSKGEIFYDLGSGDGRALIIAAREFGAHAIGIEISPIHCIVARIKILRDGVGDRVKIKWASFYHADFKDADIIFVYMTSQETTRLRPRLESQLRAGTRIIAISCEIKGWQPVAFDRDEVIFIYQMGTSP